MADSSVITLEEETAQSMLRSPMTELFDLVELYVGYCYSSLSQWRYTHARAEFF